MVGRTIGRSIGRQWGLHIRKKHRKGKEKWTKCYICLTGYSFYVSLPILIGWGVIRIAKAKKVKINIMDETLIYLLVILGILLVPLLSILLNYYFEKKKLAAETEKIELQNKITKEITYDQLKSESKHKDIKNKIEILQRLNRLEEELKNKENKTKTDQKKLESLEMIKKEFGQTFIAQENPPLAEPAKLTKKQNSEQTSKVKKIKSANTIRQKKKKTKKKK